MPPAMKSTSAMVWWKRTCENMTPRKAIVRPNREMVSLFGRFIRSGSGGTRHSLIALFVTRETPVANLGVNARVEVRLPEAERKARDLEITPSRKRDAAALGGCGYGELRPGELFVSPAEHTLGG